jgi:PhnB protein
MAKAKGAKKAGRRGQAKASAQRRLPSAPRSTTATPHLLLRGGADAIEFYKKAFGAREISRTLSPDGKGLMHAEIKIGDASLFLAEEFPGSRMRSPQALGGTTVVVHLYLRNCDAAYSQALAAGAKPLMPPGDMFWGDRYSQVEDPFGHTWAIATKKEILTPRELAKRTADFFAKATK